jgi:hypothetical protein
MGKKAHFGHLHVLVWFCIKNCLDSHIIWLTLDGEERNVAQRCLQFVSNSMEVARSKISRQIYLYIIEVVTRHSQIAVWWTKKVYLHPLVSILLMEKRIRWIRVRQLNHGIPTCCHAFVYKFANQKSRISLNRLVYWFIFFYNYCYFSNMCFIIIYWLHCLYINGCVNSMHGFFYCLEVEKAKTGQNGICGNSR